ncbi:capsid assembly scaffolding protein Gp46 family protein [Roseateles sp.]|uniref:capsid assembly scaffolding protein Gp46 family protein n=1 Tax=Roseateles sp. TaxID=1971397 RepID=UPI002F41E845
MTQPTTTPPAAADPAPTTFTQADLDRIVADRLSRERGKYADYDQLKTKASEFDKLADAQKTEAQKAADAVTAAEAKAQAAERRALLLEVASEKGITAAQAKRLVGNTRDELLADADEFLQSLPGAQPQQPSGRRPVEALKSGSLPAGQASAPGDPNEWMRKRSSRN